MLLTTTHALPREKADDALALTDLIPTLALDVAEHPDDPTLYQLTWFLDADQEINFISMLSEKLNVQGEVVLSTVDESVDYIAATRAAFPPLTVGPFFIARNDEPTPAGMLGLNIMPNRAFGSGEHATTRACLESYLALTESGKTFSNGLDVGTGSAILALAAAKLQNTPFLGTDNDAPSVAIAQTNAQENGVTTFTALEDETLIHPAIAAKSPFNLIFANILMLPLIDLAPAISTLLTPGGYLILSGFTDDQQQNVHNAYLAQGLTHVGTRTIIDESAANKGAAWCASTFTK